MKEIVKDNLVLARHIQKEDIKEGLNFYSKDNEYIQVGAWCYGEGKELAAHIHNKEERTIYRTYEVLYVISGALEATIYDLNENKEEILVIEENEILVLLEGGHGYKILKEDTKVLEIKNGPYLGADIDRRRI